MGATLDPHFFRHESGRLVAALVRVFGVHNLSLAEDVAQDALCRALEVWKLGGLPDNPSAWLLAAARNKAIDVLRRDKTARTFAPELGRLLDSEWTMVHVVGEILEPDALRDDELRLMFSICHPRLGEDAQVALVLSICCGFSPSEIGSAFLCSAAAIEKRIARAKSTLAETRSLFDLDAADLSARQNVVHAAIYLLFNEGYHGASSEVAVRAVLCEEALRLAALLGAHPKTATPEAHALEALMCLHAARLPARVSAEGQLRALFDQDRTKWDRSLIARGLALLDRSATGDALSAFHLEAAIAAMHAGAARREDTPWSEIVALYDLRYALDRSPVIALSRAIAIAEASGPQAGLAALAAIEDRERLASYPFYEAALGELHMRAGEIDAACNHFRAAHNLARNAMERRFFAERAASCAAPDATRPESSSADGD